MAAPMPSLKMRAHRDRREVPITSWVAFVSRAKSSSAVGTSSPTTVCTVASRLLASSRTLPISRGGHAGQPVAADDVHHHQLARWTSTRSGMPGAPTFPTPGHR